VAEQQCATKLPLVEPVQIAVLMSSSRAGCKRFAIATRCAISGAMAKLVGVGSM
jgi:hypothetical protein